MDVAKLAIDSHGLGMASVRFICGTQDLHRELEVRLAEFLKTEDAILFASCFDANAGIFEALLGEEGYGNYFRCAKSRFDHRWRAALQGATLSL